MAFTAIVNTEIESGDPTTQDLWTKVKTDFDDHETRIVSLEGGSAVVYRPLEFIVSGPYGQYVPFNNTGVIRLNFNINILAGRLLIHTAGSSGTTEIDFKYKSGAGAWTTIFSTKPSVAQSSGDYAVSTNGVLSVTALSAGDLLRMDITTTQAGTPMGLTGIFEFEKA